MIAVGIAMFVVANSGQTLSPDEKKIVDFIDRNNASAIALLETTVNIESPTEDIAGVKKVGSVYQKEFESLGMKTTWIDLPPEFKRAGHLMAESTGNCGKRLLLLGHLDTVLRGEPYRLDGTRAFGTGIGDMKGGNLIIIQALKALQAVGALKDTRIIVMFTGDEEDTADPIEASRRDMVAAAKRSDAALSFEGTVLNTATVGRRGFSSWRLEVTAKTGHSGQIFRDGMGHGAVFEAARILNEFRIALSKEKYLTFNPSLIVGGTTVETKDADGRAFGKTNVVAAKAVVNGDLRFISEAQKLSARTRMMEIVAKSLPGTTATITFEDGLPAMSPNDGNYGLLADLDKVSKDLGFGAIEALDPGERGAGDIAFVADLVPSLDGIGIGGSRASHAKGESAELSSLPMLTKRAALLIYRLTR
ncbi:MAG: M20/M25/M40 family metallo-hydrolase [Chloracidobacterium sp.]|nr:M20/M25/M40 family metallo-hydrolase [Chloracidobacterium sp.]